jgi:hypothetical protein
MVSDHDVADRSCSRILQVALTAVCVVLAVGGNMVTIVSLNFWLLTFPSQTTSGQFAAQFSSGIMYFFAFLVAACGYMLCFYCHAEERRRIIHSAFGSAPSIRLRRVGLLLLMGLTDVGSNLIALYATPGTPEILQGFLQGTTPLWTVLLSYHFVKGEKSKNYRSALLIVSIVLMVAGIIVSGVPIPFPSSSEGSASAAVNGSGSNGTSDWHNHSFSSGHGNSSDGSSGSAADVPPESLVSRILWTLIYASSAVVYAAWCITQRQYLDLATPVDSLDGVSAPTAGVPAGLEGSSSPVEKLPLDSNNQRSAEQRPLLSGSLQQPKVPHSEASWMEPQLRGGLAVWGKEDDGLGVGHERRSNPRDGVMVKLIMLAMDTGFAMVLTIVLLPLDAIPWFGSSKSIDQTWGHFTDGLECVYWRCDHSLVYGAIYTTGYFLTYIGNAYLNHFAPTVNSLTVQLSGPLTALLLLVAPSLNVDLETPLWYQQISAAVLICVAGVCFTVWERRQAQMQS